MLAKLALVTVLIYNFVFSIGQNVSLPGICLEEVPTSSLHTRNGTFILVGHGLTPSVSIIRVCCTGYDWNIHNSYICDPVCEEPCINGLCVAPNTCACYPDYVKNLQGKCIATCPIGCAKGKCSANTQLCVCNTGYKLDDSKRFCVPMNVDAIQKCDGNFSEFMLESAPSEHVETTKVTQENIPIIALCVLAILVVLLLAELVCWWCRRRTHRRMPFSNPDLASSLYERPLPEALSTETGCFVELNDFDKVPVNNLYESDLKRNPSVNESLLTKHQRNSSSLEHIYNELQEGHYTIMGPVNELDNH